MKITGNLKFFFSIIGALFIGALGSGLWEELLKPIFHFLGVGFVRLMSKFFSSYQDSIYKIASNGFHEYPSMLLLVFLLLFMIMMYHKIMQNHPQSKNSQTNFDKTISQFMKSRRGYFTTCFISLASIVFLLAFMIQISFANEITTYAEKSIHIISPYLEENERLILKAKFASVEGAEDFSIFKEDLENVANKNNVELPDLNLF